jgi:hypothetical protein
MKLMTFARTIFAVSRSLDGMGSPVGRKAMERLREVVELRGVYINVRFQLPLAIIGSETCCPDI